METQIIKGLNSYLTFQLGEERFAVNIGHVKKILEMTEITKVPHVPDYYLGVINLFGEVLPVISAGKRFGIEVAEQTEKTCIVVLMLEAGEEVYSVGLMVDQVHHVMGISSDQLQPPPTIGKRFHHEFIESIANVNEEFIIVLDVDKLFYASDLELINSVES
ncbi:chemotaxis protein CheW [Sunxiuqinia sp. A32]|uniref:chemotaxis protein CheW n=1 Tax=Sunxiuqinia sp. A32 TaxID=3461496 RepID=UPI004045614B